MQMNTNLALIVSKAILKSAKLGTIKVNDMREKLDGLYYELPDEEVQQAIKIETEISKEDKANYKQQWEKIEKLRYEVDGLISLHDEQFFFSQHCKDLLQDIRYLKSQSSIVTGKTDD